MEHQLGSTLNLKAQYVGTRAVNQPYHHASERLSDRLPRLFLAVSV